MCFFGIGHPILVGIALQLLHDACSKPLACLRGCGSDDGCDRCRCQVVQRELIQTREVDIHPIDVHCYLGKARFSCETFQFLSGRCLPRCAKADGCFVAHKSNERFTDGAVIESDVIPHAECETAATTEHASHLPQRERFVRKELKSLLAKNHVKAFSLQSKIDGAAHKPLDRCTNRCWEGLRDPDHSGIQIESNNTSGGTDTLRRNSSNDARPASDVQHALTNSHMSGIDEGRCPRTEDVPGDITLIQFGRLRGQVPLLVPAHRPFHPSFREIRSAACVTALIWLGGGEAGMYWMEPAIATAPA